MNTVRRTAVLLGLTLAVILVSSIPASATFTDSVQSRPTLATGTVTAPATVTTARSCTGWSITVTVGWTAATATGGVAGYRVMAYLNDGTSVVMAETTPAIRSVTQTVDQAYLAYQPRLSIITLTSYNWTAETARTAVLTC